MTLDEALQQRRIAICGGPRRGKTTLAGKLALDSRAVVHTDDFIQLGYAGIGEALAGVCGELQSFVIEGVRAANALRAGLAVDVAIWIETPKVMTTPGQEHMNKGVRTVFDQWRALDGGRTPVVIG